MVVEISTLGSCSSRNIFYSNINPGYKNFFHINESIESVTLISLMSDSVEFDEVMLDSGNQYDNYCVNVDFSKNFLNFLKKNEIDYLILDTHFDVVYDVIILDDNKFITDSERLINTSLYDLFKDKKKINIRDDYDEYLLLFKRAVDSFFEFISDYCPKTKLVLNCSRGVFKYKNDDGVIVSNPKLKRMAMLNQYRDILDQYILKKYDVEVLCFDNNTLADKNHVFGIHAVHYEPSYYKKKTQQLNDIIGRNNFLSYYSKYNAEFRQIIRKNILLQFELNSSLNKVPMFFDKYLTARFDIRNEKNKDNSIEVIFNSDENATIEYPWWFDNVMGKGIVVHSQKQKIDLDIKCINDGMLLLRFMGKDVRDKNNERIPIYICYNEIWVNGKKINEDALVVSHDQPFIYKLPVEGNEIVNLKICWSPF